MLYCIGFASRIARCSFIAREDESSSYGWYDYRYYLLFQVITSNTSAHPPPATDGGSFPHITTSTTHWPSIPSNSPQPGTVCVLNRKLHFLLGFTVVYMEAYCLF